MKVYITKYALTRGIEYLDAEDVEDGMVRVMRAGLSAYLREEGREWHRTFESARDEAEYMREAEIEFLDAKIRRMGNIKFVDPS